MPSVYHSSRFNSTNFTTCCHVAINDDQERCPRCKAEIFPKSARGRWEVAYGPYRAAQERKGERK